MNLLDFMFKAFYRICDILRYLLRKPFIGKLGKGSYLKPGVKIVGNPYRIKIGNNFKIWHRSFLSVSNGFILIGNNGLLGVNSYINATEGFVKIGNNVAIAPYCKIFTYSHHYGENKLITECHKTGNVVIENNVLVGANVVILPNVVIHEGAIVAASSVVLNDVPANTIVGGIPAKTIKIRNS